MISAEHYYFAVSAVLALACLAGIFLAGKHIPEKRLRTLMIVALVFMILSTGILSLCQKVFRYLDLAAAGDAVGATQGAFAKVDQFRFLFPFGNLFELAAIGIFLFVAKQVISLRAGDRSEGGSKT
jgi:hypothetical protein